MSKKVSFIFGLHNHQPVGNFDHVFEEAYRKAYSPFLEILYEYPDIPFAIHNSGVLWDWLVERHPDYVERLGAMVSRGQVEVMSGGYYEPILSVIPERDRQGQLAVMRKFLHERFGVTPRGCWLTERIWEPHLPETLSEAGLEYVIVDDAHFKSTGFSSEEMRGYFRTEEDGRYINVFPIDKKLRYLIPFSDPEETISYLRGIASGGEESRRIAVLADDGEKFGLWPGTHDLCYEQGWLRRFCDQLMKNEAWLEMTTFSRVIDTVPPIGIVYLPTAAYTEMMEWALPIRAQERYERAEEILTDNGDFDEPATLVRGGFWRNFLVKYEESNWMHKRMMVVSELLEKYRVDNGEDRVWEEARNHLYQAQCNCAYWHGLFGGLYLPHLRSAVYSHLISAENLVEKAVHGRKPFVAYSQYDIDGDGTDELVVTAGAVRTIWGFRGAALRELDLRNPAFNLTDTLTRREELYHRRLTSITSDKDGTAEEAISIHNISSAKEKNLDKYLIYDFHIRSSFLDHFISDEVDLDSFSTASYEERGDFIEGCYRFTTRKSGRSTVFVFERDGTVRLPGKAVSVSVSKEVRVSATAPELEVRYSITPSGDDLRCRLAVESVFSLLAGDAPDRYFRFPDREVAETNLASKGEEEDVGSLSIIDEWLDVDVEISFKPLASFWRFPIDTVSNSESGFERVYQGSAVVPVWHLDLSGGKTATIIVRLRVKPVRK